MNVQQRPDQPRTPKQEVLAPEPRWYKQVYNEKYGSW